MSDTPRTDAAIAAQQAAPAGYSELANEARKLERDFNVATRLAVEQSEENLLLKEQIRVADVAFNSVNERHNTALARIRELTEWRPMETAKELLSGSVVMLLTVGACVIPAWLDENGEWYYYGSSISVGHQLKGWLPLPEVKL